jgi:protocatechuate 3,4-dioxygenase, beta subunit
MPQHTASARQLVTRRKWVGFAAQATTAIALPFVWGSARAQASAPRRLTPRQTEGPFYPDKMPTDTDFDLLRNGTRNYTQGQGAWVSGSVTDMDGKPVAGAAVEIWQCDNEGHYHHSGDGNRADPAFQGFGRVLVAADGSYRFRTLRPVAYGGRAPHIHVKVKLGNRELLTTQLYVAGDPNNERDGPLRYLRDPADREALTVPFVAGTEGLQAKFPIVVAA